MPQRNFCCSAFKTQVQTGVVKHRKTTAAEEMYPFVISLLTVMSENCSIHYKNCFTDTFLVSGFYLIYNLIV